MQRRHGAQSGKRIVVWPSKGSSSSLVLFLAVLAPALALKGPFFSFSFILVLFALLIFLPVLCFVYSASF